MKVADGRYAMIAIGLVIFAAKHGAGTASTGPTIGHSVINAGNQYVRPVRMPKNSTNANIVGKKSALIVA